MHDYGGIPRFNRVPAAPGRHCNSVLAREDSEEHQGPNPKKNPKLDTLNREREREVAMLAQATKHQAPRHIW